MTDKELKKSIQKKHRKLFWRSFWQGFDIIGAALGRKYEFIEPNYTIEEQHYLFNEYCREINEPEISLEKYKHLHEVSKILGIHR